MKTELRIRPHHLRPGEQVVEVFYNGQRAMTVAGFDGPAVQITSHLDLEAEKFTGQGDNKDLTVMVVQTNVRSVSIH